MIRRSLSIRVALPIGLSAAVGVGSCAAILAFGGPASATSSARRSSAISAFLQPAAASPSQPLYLLAGLVAAKPQPPKLNKEEEQAIENKVSGKPYNQRAYKSALQKIKETQKIIQERNRQKRQSNFSFPDPGKEVAEGLGATGAAGVAVAVLADAGAGLAVA